MINQPEFMQDIVKMLLATKDPAEKAAIIAELTLSELPERVAFVARRCIAFHWFDQSILEVLLKEFSLTKDEIRNVYEQLETLPFVEKLPWGLSFQDLTREGLLKRYASEQPDLLNSTALQAASVYETYNDDKNIAEAASCYFMAHNDLIGEQLTDKLTKRALERGDQQFVDNLRSLLNEARQISDATVKNAGSYSSVIPKEDEVHMDDRTGQQFGKYHLVRLLGRGTFAEVYLGEHIHLNTHAAVKLLHKSLTEEDAERFLAEARMLARLKHPHIVSVLDFDMEQTTPVFVMEYAPGGTLRRRFPVESRLPLTIIVRYVKQIAQALQYAHDRNVIHRDVKPENMLLASDGYVLLSDFGLALLAPSPELLSDQAMAGTRPYMAPEQIRGRPTFASDQYALAIIVYEWLCGVRPFKGTYWEILQKHLFQPPPSLHTDHPDIPVSIEAVVLKALSKDPLQRFVNVQDFAQAFIQASQREILNTDDPERTQPRLPAQPHLVILLPPVTLSQEEELPTSQELSTPQELPAPQEPHDVFLSYASPDTTIAQSLKADLSQRGVQFVNDLWPTLDSESSKEGELREAMRSAYRVLVVVTPHTRSSRIMREHLRMAGIYQRRLIFVWMAGESIAEMLLEAWSYAVALEVVDAREARYPVALDELVARIDENERNVSSLKTLPPVLQQEPRNPYKGLHAFTQQDATDFFGRTALIDEMVKSVQGLLVREQSRQPASRLLTVIGPSGSGKSSVVMAGLLPLLRKGALPGSADWIYLDPMVPGKDPIEALVQVLEPHLSQRNFRMIEEDLQDDSARGLHRLARSLVKDARTKVVLLIDQFEELFSPDISEQKRQQMIGLLLTAVSEPGGSVLVLLTLRADFYDRPMHYPELSRLIKENSVSVLPMELQELRAVIEQPALLPDVQLFFEGNLLGDLLFEAQGQVGALPLLEFTLDELFQRRDGRTLTMAAYREMGGVKGALVRHAKSTYASLPSNEHRFFARVLFTRLVTLGMTDQDTTRHRATRSELSLTNAKQTALLSEVTDTFIKARLLTANEHVGITTIEVSHEALIREWTQLSNWLREKREEIRIQQALRNAVAEWEVHKKSKDHLYRGSQLKVARTWARHNEPNKQETAFLRASALQRVQFAVGVIVIFLLLATSGSAAAWFALRPSPDPTLVTNSHDDGTGSLRWAIDKAEAGSTIKFAPGVRGTILLKSKDLVFSKNLTIQGPGASALTVSSGNTGNVVQVHDRSSVTMFDLSFKDSDTGERNFAFLSNLGTLKLINTNISGNTTISSKKTSGLGGGIYNANTLTLINSTVSNNSAQYGGGIYNDEGTLTVVNSTISGNKALAQNASGGGIYSFGPLILTSSTISGNVSSKTGGGITVDRSQATVIFCTIYDNTAQDGGGLSIENTQTRQSHVEMGNSIMAGNHAPVGTDIAGTLTSDGYNLIQNVSQASLLYGNSPPTDLTHMSPNVGPLQNNDGPTETHALDPGSPAIDKVPLNACHLDTIPTDQRRVKRPQGSACDIGAYEEVSPH